MKNSLLFMGLSLCLSFAFVACEKEDIRTDDSLITDIALATDRVAVDLAELPTDVRTYLEEVHFDTYLEEAYLIRDRGYELNLGSDDRLFLTLDGRVLEFGGPLTDRFGPDGPHGPCHRRGIGFGRPIRIDSLPPAIFDYVAANYPDNEIRRAKKRGNHLVVLVDAPAVLVFDLDGNFEQEVSFLHRCHRRCRNVTEAELPGPVADYIAANHADETFRAACARRGKVAVLLIGDDGRHILVFDQDGNLLFER